MQKHYWPNYPTFTKNSLFMRIFCFFMHITMQKKPFSITFNPTVIIENSPVDDLVISYLIINLPHYPSWQNRSSPVCLPQSGLQTLRDIFNMVFLPLYKLPNKNMLKYSPPVSRDQASCQLFHYRPARLVICRNGTSLCI